MVLKKIDFLNFFSELFLPLTNMTTQLLRRTPLGKIDGNANKGFSAEQMRALETVAEVSRIEDDAEVSSMEDEAEYYKMVQNDYGFYKMAQNDLDAKKKELEEQIKTIEEESSKIRSMRKINGDKLDKKKIIKKSLKRL